MGFNVGNLYVGGQKTIVIAEAGVNHLKRTDYAEQLIKTAKDAGVDIIKFQTYDAKKLTTKDAPRFWNWEGERLEAGSQYDSYDVLATPERDFTQKLISICDKYDIEFMSTPFDLDSVNMLNEIGCKAFKIASGDITNFPLLREVAKIGKPVFLSSGASDILDIKLAISELTKIKPNLDICIMHCNLCYPSRPEDANLSAVIDIKSHFPNYEIGLSDHTIGPLIPAASCLLGVKAIEKHYTFDNSLPDSADHWLSINSIGMSKMVNMLRTLEKAYGNELKGVNKSEERARANARRSMVARGKINKGEKFTSENIIMKRPGSGISPIYYDEIIGLTASRDLNDDQIIMPTDIIEDASFKPITPDLIGKSIPSHED